MGLQLRISRGGRQGGETPEVVQKTTWSPPSRLCWPTGVCMEANRDSPIKNLRMDPRSRTLTWDLSGNVSKIECALHSGYTTKAKNNRYCQLYVVPSCEVTNYSVTVTMTTGQLFSTSILYPVQEGNPGAAARNLDCWVHDVDFLTCHWVVGPEAPDDVQYRLYVEDLETYTEWECPRYGEDHRGTHVRCYFDVTGLSEQLHFLVKGTSRGPSIPCSELCVDLMETERLRLPNITARCNKSHSIMEWKMASHFNDRFVYKLQIQKLISENSFVLYNPGIYTVRLQAKGGFQDFWSQWSAPQRFGEWAAHFSWGGWDAVGTAPQEGGIAPRWPPARTRFSSPPLSVLTAKEGSLGSPPLLCPQGGLRD
ncbi:hypothetical protein MC885_006304, partial [Smutsia gigantea]